MSIVRIARTMLATAFPLLLAACGTPPRDSFYTLNAAAAPAAAQRKTSYSVAVGPVIVPEMVDRPQLVVRESPNRVDVLEHHRWAQPLPDEIARVLAADLRTLLPDAQVVSAADDAGGNAGYRIRIDIEQFEAAPGRGVTVQAAWTVHRASDGVSRSARSLLLEPAHGSYEALAAAFSRALADMSVEIGNAVQVLRPGAM